MILSFARKCTKSVLFTGFILPMLTFSLTLHGAPTGQQVIQGDVQFSQQGATTTINASDGSIIHYDSFNIDMGETVRFIQPNEASRVLNRVNSSDVTQINGSLLSNGQVYILNPSGIFFGGEAIVDVGALFAASANMTNQDFLNGNNLFTNLSGDVVNMGTIQGQMIHLIGNQVRNLGTVIAPNGMVTFSSGSTVYIGDNGGNVYVQIETDGAQSAYDPSVAGVSNEGTIDAGGGQVVLGAGDLYALSVYNQGTVKADTIQVQGGQDSFAHINGTLDASNYSEGGAGGEIEVTAKRVVLDSATLDASGDAGGGSIKLGGDYQGGGTLYKSELTGTSENTTLMADAVTSGDGGEIILWSDGFTQALGTYSARGGATSGNGGLIETSGLTGLNSRPVVDLSAPNGDSGTLLFDPINITIFDGVGTTNVYTTALFTTNLNEASLNGAEIGDTTINNFLDGGTNVTIRTTDPTDATDPNQNGDIILESDAQIVLSPASFTNLILESVGSIKLFGEIRDNGFAGTSNLFMTAGENIEGGTAFGGVSVPILTNNVTVNATAGDFITFTNNAPNAGISPVQIVGGNFHQFTARALTFSGLEIGGSVVELNATTDDITIDYFESSAQQKFVRAANNITIAEALQTGGLINSYTAGNDFIGGTSSTNFEINNPIANTDITAGNDMTLVLDFTSAPNPNVNLNAGNDMLLIVRNFDTLNGALNATTALGDINFSWDDYDGGPLNLSAGNDLEVGIFNDTNTFDATTVSWEAGNDFIYEKNVNKGVNLNSGEFNIAAGRDVEFRALGGNDTFTVDDLTGSGDFLVTSGRDINFKGPVGSTDTLSILADGDITIAHSGTEPGRDINFDPGFDSFWRADNDNDNDGDLSVFAKRDLDIGTQFSGTDNQYYEGYRLILDAGEWLTADGGTYVAKADMLLGTSAFFDDHLPYQAVTLNRAEFISLDAPFFGGIIARSDGSLGASNSTFTTNSNFITFIANGNVSFFNTVVDALLDSSITIESLTGAVNINDTTFNALDNTVTIFANEGLTLQGNVTGTKVNAGTINLSGNTVSVSGVTTELNASQDVLVNGQTSVSFGTGVQVTAPLIDINSQGNFFLANATFNADTIDIFVENDYNIFGSTLIGQDLVRIAAGHRGEIQQSFIGSGLNPITGKVELIIEDVPVNETGRLEIEFGTAINAFGEVVIDVDGDVLVENSVINGSDLIDMMATGRIDLLGAELMSGGAITIAGDEEVQIAFGNGPTDITSVNGPIAISSALGSVLVYDSIPTIQTTTSGDITFTALLDVVILNSFVSSAADIIINSGRLFSVQASQLVASLGTINAYNLGDTNIFISALSGQNILVQSEGETSISGSSFLGGNDVTVYSEGNLSASGSVVTSSGTITFESDRLLDISTNNSFISDGLMVLDGLFGVTLLNNQLPSGFSTSNGNNIQVKSDMGNVLIQNSRLASAGDLLIDAGGNITVFAGILEATQNLITNSGVDTFITSSSMSAINGELEINSMKDININDSNLNGQLVDINAEDQVTVENNSFVSSFVETTIDGRNIDVTQSTVASQIDLIMTAVDTINAVGAFLNGNQDTILNAGENINLLTTAIVSGRDTALNGENIWVQGNSGISSGRDTTLNSLEDTRIDNSSVSATNLLTLNVGGTFDSLNSSFLGELITFNLTDLATVVNPLISGGTGVDINSMSTFYAEGGQIASGNGFIDIMALVDIEFSQMTSVGAFGALTLNAGQDLIGFETLFNNGTVADFDAGGNILMQESSHVSGGDIFYNAGENLTLERLPQFVFLPPKVQSTGGNVYLEANTNVLIDGYDVLANGTIDIHSLTNNIDIIDDSGVFAFGNVTIGTPEDLTINDSQIGSFDNNILIDANDDFNSTNSSFNAGLDVNIEAGKTFQMNNATVNAGQNVHYVGEKDIRIENGGSITAANLVMMRAVRDIFIDVPVNGADIDIIAGADITPNGENIGIEPLIGSFTLGANGILTAANTIMVMSGDKMGDIDIFGSMFSGDLIYLNSPKGAINQYGNGILQTHFLDMVAKKGIGNLGTIMSDADLIQAVTKYGDINIYNYFTGFVEVLLLESQKGNIKFKNFNPGDLLVQKAYAKDGDMKIVNYDGDLTLIDLVLEGFWNTMKVATKGNSGTIYFGQLLNKEGIIIANSVEDMQDNSDDELVDLWAKKIFLTAVGDIGGFAPPGLLDPEQQIEVIGPTWPTAGGGIFLSFPHVDLVAQHSVYHATLTEQPELYIGPVKTLEQVIGEALYASAEKGGTRDVLPQLNAFFENEVYPILLRNNDLEIENFDYSAHPKERVRGTLTVAYYDYMAEREVFDAEGFKAFLASKEYHALANYYLMNIIEVMEKADELIEDENIKAALEEAIRVLVKPRPMSEEQWYELTE